MTMMYWDRYERIDARWYFRRRLPLYWYATDLNRPPIGDRKIRWPGRQPYEGGFHQFWPTWAEFWAASADPDREVAEPVPLDEWLSQVRRGAPEQLNVRVR